MDNLQTHLDASFHPNAVAMVVAPVHTWPVREDFHRGQILWDLKSLAHNSDKARVHIGVAGFFNFDCAATGHSDGLVLIDHNLDQVRFWRSLIPLLASAATIEDFKQAFFSRIKLNPDIPLNCSDAAYYYLDSDGATSQKVILRGNGVKKNEPGTKREFLADQEWIRSPRMYAHLHQMAKEGRIAAVGLDLFDTEQCQKLKDAIISATIGDKKATINSVYGSNVHDMLQMQPDSGMDDICDNVTIKMRRATPASLRLNGEVFNSIAEYLCVEANNHSKKLMEDLYKPSDAAIRDTTAAFITCIVERSVESGKTPPEEFYNELWMHGANDKVLEDMGCIKHIFFTPINYPGPIKLRDKPDYTGLLALADSAETRIYAASTEDKTLLRFQGPESASASWRAKIKPAKDMALRPGSQDQIIGR